jgi:hypothetical protein
VKASSWVQVVISQASATMASARTFDGAHVERRLAVVERIGADSPATKLLGSGKPDPANARFLTVEELDPDAPSRPLDRSPRTVGEQVQPTGPTIRR